MDWTKLLRELDAVCGSRLETIVRIKDWRYRHGGTIADAVMALTKELIGQTLITPEQVQTAIAVLNAFVTEQLSHIDAALLDQLADAIDLAAYGPIEVLIGDEPPVNLG